MEGNQPHALPFRVISGGGNKMEANAAWRTWAVKCLHFAPMVHNGNEGKGNEPFYVTVGVPAKFSALHPH